MRESQLRRDDADLRVLDTEAGFPVIFQHGLGGDEAQVAINFPDGPEWRRITVECRGQGGSTPGTVRPFRIAMFADDVLAAADALGIDRFVVGGISMGAAIALRIAALHPERVAGLILARPAWLTEAAPDNMRLYAEVAALLAELPPDEARARFAASATAARLTTLAPDNLASLLGFFDRPDPALTAALLGDIAADGPGVDPSRIHVPTLVIGHDVDLAHPLAYARTLAALIPSAEFVEIAPKATEKARHIREFRAAIETFLATHFSARES